MIRQFLLAWLAGQSPSPDAMQHIQAGLEARRQHQVETEIVEFRKATELEPALADAFINLGAAYMEKGDYGAAIRPLKRALEISSDLVVAHQFLGYALLEQGYAAEAVPHLQRAGALDALGVAQIETGQLNEAVATFSAALANSPNDRFAVLPGPCQRAALEEVHRYFARYASRFRACAPGSCGELFCSTTDATSRKRVFRSVTTAARSTQPPSGIGTGVCKLRAMAKSGNRISRGG